MSSRIVLPGTTFPTPPPSSKLGPGLHLLPPSSTSSSSPSSTSSSSHSLTALKAGLHTPTHSPTGTLTSQLIDSSHTRYSPSPNDSLIGLITARFSEGYKIDCAACVSGSLDALGFDGVNRKSKPNLGVGDVVFGRVTYAEASMEFEMTCLSRSDGSGNPKSSSSSSSNGGYGVLEGGYLMTRVPLGLCRRLLRSQDVTLSVIGERVAYEVVVGMNGRIWVTAESKRVVARVCEVLRKVEGLREGEVRELVAKAFKDL